MAIKRIVDTGFWIDNKVMDMFSPEDKLFMLYLMTNPHTSQLGVYPINIKYMALELGYSQDTIKVLLDRFQSKYNIIKYSNESQEIAIRNYLKYSIVKGGKPVEDCLMKEITVIKDKSLLQYVYDNLVNCDNLNSTVEKILPYLNFNENDNENDNDNDNDVSYHDSYNDSYHDSIPQNIPNYVFITIITNTKEEYPITIDLVNQYKETYPNVDVEQELRNMKAWSISNPKKRKTKNGMLKFVNSWLSREQDKPKYNQPTRKEPVPEFLTKEINQPQELSPKAKLKALELQKEFKKVSKEEYNQLEDEIQRLMKGNG